MHAYGVALVLLAMVIRQYLRVNQMERTININFLTRYFNVRSNVTKNHGPCIQSWPTFIMIRKRMWRNKTLPHDLSLCQHRQVWGMLKKNTFLIKLL